MRSRPISLIYMPNPHTNSLTYIRVQKHLPAIRSVLSNRKKSQNRATFQQRFTKGHITSNVCKKEREREGEGEVMQPL